MHDKQLSVLQVVGYSNSGKTTLMEKIIMYGVKQLFLKIACLKHDVHGFQLDQEGKDTWKHRQAGAELSLIQSPLGIGITMDCTPEQSLKQLIKLIHSVGNYDIVLAEGFKKERFPKIVLLRTTNDFNLITELTHIRLLLFWNESDQRIYRQGVATGIWPQIDSFLLEKDQDVIEWVHSFWMNQRGGKEKI